MFHEMTEYFVKKLDYQDTEGIFLVYRLHKETLKENFDLRMILEECRREEEERQKEKGGLPDTAVFSTDDEYEKEWKKEMYNSPLPDTAREEHIRYGLLGKAVRKIKRGRWGKWEDLITEMDGQEAKGRL